jgi:hypothetical protein
MNDQARKTLERIEQEFGSPRRRPRRGFSMSLVVFALGLILADVLLTMLVPRIWVSVLPHGLDTAAHFVGWPRLVWQAAVFCHYRQRVVQVGIVVAVLLGLMVSASGRPGRILVWLSAVGVIVLNALVMIITIKAALNVTAAAAGIDLGG